jgi:hypothetical protein
LRNQGKISIADKNRKTEIKVGDNETERKEITKQGSRKKERKNKH